MSEWQDISTAPTDGTRVLAIVAGHHPETGRSFQPTIAFYHGEWLNDVNSERWAGEVVRKEDYDPWNPTHWMPLPEAPVIP